MTEQGNSGRKRVDWATGKWQDEREGAQPRKWQLKGVKRLCERSGCMAGHLKDTLAEAKKTK